MKLITEHTTDVKILTEEKEGKKHFFIEGIFMQADQRNKNGRVYPFPILSRECGRYVTEYVQQNRALGELGHPEGPSVNLERVSHIIKELNVSGKDVIGKAKIMETPYGKIVQNLMDEGARLGVSSRGMGSLREFQGINMVQEDFSLAAVDIVADPSAPNAFVNGIMEGKEWVWENGIIKPVVIENYKKQITKTSQRKLEEEKLKIFKDFLSKL
jgi:hypothetical protein